VGLERKRNKWVRRLRGACWEERESRTSKSLLNETSNGDKRRLTSGEEGGEVRGRGTRKDRKRFQLNDRWFKNSEEADEEKKQRR